MLLQKSTSPLSVGLPVELFLDVLNHAIIQHRRDELYWTLSLSLVCRTARNLVLPIFYEVLFIDIGLVPEGVFTGWDGREYKHAQLALLSWLLHDSSAPPRQHIKHLVFRHEGSFNIDDITWDGPGSGSKSAEWLLERVTVRYLTDMECLYAAGLRPRRAFYIGTPDGIKGEMPCDLFSTTILNELPLAERRLHSLLRASAPEEVTEDDGRTSIRIKHQYIACCEIEPETTDFISDHPPADDAGPILLTVRLFDDDYFQRFPELLLAGLAAFIREIRNARMVLVCGADYKIASLSLVDFIRAAVPATLPQDAVQGRIRICDTGFTLLPYTNDFFGALASELRCGGDPWGPGMD